jgi:cyclopropane fatty-acyl-phospholipid synthase-like methyltransferase
MPIAIKTDDPKAQHYEVPTSFFNMVLGSNLKYRYGIYFRVHFSFLKFGRS